MSALDDTLSQLHQTLAEFIKFLEEEAMALASQNADALTSMIPRRDAIHRALAAQWLHLAKIAGTDAPQGLTELREHLFAKSSPSKAWQQLEELVHVTDRLNRINGRLIEEQMRRNQAAMQVLQRSLTNREVYGADGKVSGFPNMNRRIDSA